MGRATFEVMASSIYIESMTGLLHSNYLIRPTAWADTLIRVARAPKGARARLRAGFFRYDAAEIEIFEKGTGRYRR